MSEPTEEVYESAYQAFKRAPLGSSIVRAIVDHVWHLAVAEGRREAVADIERPDSGLCDCPRDENTPINPDTAAEMDHHCDCAAVVAAATMLRSYSATIHGRQCIHGTRMDEFYAEASDA